jgi:nitrilase
MIHGVSRYKVAVVQDAPILLDKRGSTEKACELIEKAASCSAKVIVFPESFISGYPDWVWVVPAGKKQIINELFTRFHENAVSIPDETTRLLCDTARKHGVFVGIGVSEINTDASRSSVYNTLLYIGPAGDILGVHRKLIPTGGERLMWAPGDGSTLISFDTEVGRIGGLICWENLMPLARYEMYRRGVQLYFAPTWDNSESWLTAMKHIAREGGMYVLSCSQALRIEEVPDSLEYKSLYPHGREWINVGNSCIVDPKGEIIAGPLKAKQDILYADIDLDSITSHKWMFDPAGHYSRPDVFEFRVRNRKADP